MSPRRRLALIPSDHRFGIGKAIVAIFVSQVLLAELAGGGVRQFLHEFDRVGQPPFGNFAVQMGADFLRGHMAVVVPDYEEKGPLIPPGMWNPDRCSLEYSRAA